MSTRFNVAFLADPLEFARNHVMIMPGGPAANLKHNDGYDSVDSADRVIYWDIEEETDDPRSGRFCRVVMSRNPQDGYRAGYWLPFDFNSIKKITLHDKRSIEEVNQTERPKAFSPRGSTAARSS